LYAPAPPAPAAAKPAGLTAAQRDRIEANKAAALKRRIEANKAAALKLRQERARQ
jgi:hypothetical protein